MAFLSPILLAEAAPPAAGAAGDQVGLLIAGFTILVLATFVGFEVISKVPPTLHTPLMSGSNAISGITVVGSIVCAGRGEIQFATVLGFLAVVLATINVVGGFLVTHRMLMMFKKK
jgi:NAD(P) transhydrogenase subunit alpha